MTRAAVIVDTNVVVAGLLTSNDTSPVARILDGMLAAAFPFVVSQALLAKYRTVLVRPNLRKLHGLTISEVETILTDLAQHAIVLNPCASCRATRARSWGPVAVGFARHPGGSATDHGRQVVASGHRYAGPGDFATSVHGRR